MNLGILIYSKSREVCHINFSILITVKAEMSIIYVSHCTIHAECTLQSYCCAKLAYHCSELIVHSAPGAVRRTVFEHVRPLCAQFTHNFHCFIQEECMTKVPDEQFQKVCTRVVHNIYP